MGVTEQKEFNVPQAIMTSNTAAVQEVKEETNPGMRICDREDSRLEND